MQENNQDSQWTHILHQEQVRMEEASSQSAPVGELVVYYLVGYHPANEDTCQETYDGQEYLTSDEVEPFEQRTAEHDQTVDSPQRQRAERTDDAGQDGDPHGGTLTGGMQLFLEEGRRHLVQ